MKRFKFLKNKYNAELLVAISTKKLYLKKNERCSKNIHTFAP